jgi:molybdate transport system regulatory protein
MKTKQDPLQLKYKFWIETSDNISILGEGKWKLLKMIRDTGSLKAAVEKMGYAYRQTWDNLRKIEKNLGFKLIEKKRGGIKGGETVLTQEGEDIVKLFDNLYNETDRALQDLFQKAITDLNKIAKESKSVKG